MLPTSSVRVLLFRSIKFRFPIPSRFIDLKHTFIKSILVKRDLFSSCGNHVYSCGTIGFPHYSRSMATSVKRIEHFILPDIGEGINEVVIKDWLVKTGDPVKEFDGICDVESDKATATISSRFEGIVTKVYYEVGDMAKVGKPLVDIEVESEVQKKEEPSSKAEEQPVREPEVGNQLDNNGTSIQTLPSVRRFARENGIDLSKVKPTGKHGHILKEDILAYLEESRTAKLAQPPASKAPPRPIESELHRPVAERPVLPTTKVPFSGIQRAMFKTMTQSLKIPHFALKNDIDMTTLVEAAARRKRADDKVSNLSFIIKMVSLALKEFPQLNASISDNEDGLVIKHHHNIGVAVDTPSGLLVPYIKNVQNLSIVEINSELQRVRQLAYSNKLGPDDLKGGTITLSNIGAIGGLVGIPVIVAPEILIGALGEIRKLPRFSANGQLEARHILELTWSADHRVVDGATLSRFTLLLKQFLEEPDSAVMKLR